MGEHPRSSGLGPALRQWFGQQPRRHGEIEADRTVSFLELFYDLVFVVLIAQIAHTLAGHVSWAGLADFVVVFGLVWIAWANGTLYHELHGREDGRSRTFIFVQMFLLVILAVYAAHATEEDGTGFAVTYALLLGVLSLQWYGVRRVDSAEYGPVTARYLTIMAISIVAMVASAFVGDDARLAVWAGLVVFWLVSMALQARFAPTDAFGFEVTESMAERFGLFTIIVLGEVVVGVVDGLSEAERDAEVIATGLLALSVGFGFWWNYFDLVGRRVPRDARAPTTSWLMLHLPLAAAIAAAGAGMVSLIAHASDQRAPEATTWLLGGASAVLLLALALLVTTIDYGPDAGPGVRRLAVGAAVGAVACVALSAIRPVGWLLALGLVAVQSAVWLHAVSLRATYTERVRL